MAIIEMKWVGSIVPNIDSGIATFIINDKEYEMPFNNFSEAHKMHGLFHDAFIFGHLCGFNEAKNSVMSALETRTFYNGYK